MNFEDMKQLRYRFKRMGWEALLFWRPIPRFICYGVRNRETERLIEQLRIVRSYQE